MKKRLLFDDAFVLLRELLPKPERQTIPLTHAIAQTLALPVHANISVPPFPRAMMDGFALRFSDLDKGVTTYRICGLSKAGEPFHGSVRNGECVRIMTGGAVPNELDTVIRYEWCTELPSNMVQVHRVPLGPGESVQPMGEDGCIGSIILNPGIILQGEDIAVARTFGVSHVAVSESLTAAIVVTGDELVRDPNMPLGPGQIYGSNDAVIQFSLAHDGVLVSPPTYVSDSHDALRTALETACDSHAVVIVTGGISAGDFDFVPTVVGDLGTDVFVESIWMRPGSPFIVGKRRDTLIVCLSGNPAAAFVQFESLVRPAIRFALGQLDEPFPFSGIIAADLELKSIKHTRVLRARAYVDEGRILVDTNHAQSPGVISSLAHTNCLVRLDESSYQQGDVVPLRWFRRPM